MMVEVTQEDCVAAARHTTGPFRNTFLEEAFARHRIAAEQRAEQRGKLEGARLAIEAAADRLIHAPPHLSMSEYAGSIRALSPAKIVGEG